VDCLALFCRRKTLNPRIWANKDYKPVIGIGGTWPSGDQSKKKDCSERDVIVIAEELGAEQRHTCCRNGTTLPYTSDALNNPTKTESNRNTLLRVGSVLGHIEEGETSVGALGM